MIKKSPIRRMAKRLCLSSEDMTLVEAAVRDEYRQMSIEEGQTAVHAIREPQRNLPAERQRRPHDRHEERRGRADQFPGH
jgi:hypothetical protein